MKKHFLLLMLMALLPFAGWAADDLTKKVVVAVADIEYGTSKFATGDIRVTLDGGEISNDYWSTEGLYESISPESGKKEVSELSTLSVGEKRYLKIEFNGAYSGYAYGEFTVSKATVKVDFTGIAFEKTYKSTTADPTLAESNISVKLGKAGTDVTSSKETYLDLEGLSYSYTGENKGSYPINFSGITLKDNTNYDLKIAEKNFTIKPANINAEEGTLFAFTLSGKDSYTYNSYEQKSTVTIAWNHDNDLETAAINLIEDKDFDVVYVNSEDDEVASPTNADTYTIKVNGKGNYTGTAVETSISFAIAQAPLTVMALPQTKVYDNKAFDAKTAEYSISGLVGSDLTKQVKGLSTTLDDTIDDEKSGANVNLNIIATPDASKATIGETVDLNTNYAITAKTSTWKITKRPVTLTIGDAKMNVEDSDFPELPSITVALAEDSEEGEGAVNATDQSTIVNAYTVKLQNEAGEKYVTELASASSAAVGTYEDAYDATGTEPGNYQVTIVKGKLIVKGKDFDIMPAVASTIQYGNPVNIILSSDGQFDPTKVTLKVTGPNDYSASVTYDADEKATWSVEQPKERGIYTIEFEGTVEGTGANAGATATCLTGVFTIVPRELTITVNEQTALKGDIAADFLAALDEEDVTIEEKLAYDDDFEALEATFQFEDVVTVTEGKIANNAGTIDNAINLTIANENYVANVTAGKLTVSTEYKATLIGDGTAPEVIAAAAANGGEYTVTIGDETHPRTLNANKWNFVVLPFTISPMDFCKATNSYAVFNRLNSASASTNSIKFSLELTEIPANEPFLVKPNVDVKFNGEDIEFKKVTVVDVAPVKTVGDATMTGTYEASMPIMETTFYAIQQGTLKVLKDVTPGTLNNQFTRAYLTLNNGSADARIFVEDIDSNGATAIKEISAETMKAIDNDGLYNLNGMKMQGVPTQKGIYIQNGKKVVIK